MRDTETDAAARLMCNVSSDFARKLKYERDEAQATLTDIYRWTERNHPDGFIDSLTYSQNLERVADHWYDRFDKVESERDEAIREMNRYKRQWEESRSENVEGAK